MNIQIYIGNDDLFKDEEHGLSKKERKKEYYVKGADLKEELRKYQEQENTVLIPIKEEEDNE